VDTRCPFVSRLMNSAHARAQNKQFHFIWPWLKQHFVSCSQTGFAKGRKSKWGSGVYVSRQARCAFYGSLWRTHLQASVTSGINYLVCTHAVYDNCSHLFFRVTQCGWERRKPFCSQDGGNIPRYVTQCTNWAHFADISGDHRLTEFKDLLTA
jgi:hypothetical protein